MGLGSQLNNAGTSCLFCLREGDTSLLLKRVGTKFVCLLLRGIY